MEFLGENLIWKQIFSLSQILNWKFNNVSDFE